MRAGEHPSSHLAHVCAAFDLHCIPSSELSQLEIRRMLAFSPDMAKTFGKVSNIACADASSCLLSIQHVFQDAEEV